VIYITTGHGTDALEIEAGAKRRLADGGHLHPN
jgi:hypothetical protein